MSERNGLDGQLGAQIKQMRLARKWSTRQLAQLAGVTHKTIYDLEAGRNVMADTLIAVLQALSCRLTITKGEDVVVVPRQRPRS